MTNEQLQLIGIQQIILDECIRAILYVRKYQKLDRTNHNLFMKNCLIKTVIIEWCQIFGSKAEAIHWTKLNLPEEYLVFGKADILQCTDFDDNEWSNYHSQMKKIRDKFFAHFDVDNLKGFIPSFDPALKILLVYRQKLIEALDRAKHGKVLIIRGFETNDELLAKIENEF